MAHKTPPGEAHIITLPACETPAQLLSRSRVVPPLLHQGTAPPQDLKVFGQDTRGDRLAHLAIEPMTRKTDRSDRRRTLRGGRRSTDWETNPSRACPACEQRDPVEISTVARLVWLRCEKCGEVWRIRRPGIS